MPDFVYECEVRKAITDSETGKRTLAWVVVSVEDALKLGDPIKRCMKCHGRIRLHRAGPNGQPGAHAEHMRRNPGCPLGDCFNGTFHMAVDTERVEIW